MTATYAPSAAPSWAVRAWLDDVNVYIEIPSSTGAPTVLKFALTEGGLTKALKLMSQRHLTERPKGESYKMPEPKITMKPTDAFTEASRDKARDVLKRLKIT